MRIDQLELRRFGKFTDQALSFPANSSNDAHGGLYVVYGGNEAGKTTSLYAIRYGLYGFPNKKNNPLLYHFLHGMPKLRIGMRITDKNGDEITFTRRKKTGPGVFTYDDADEAPEINDTILKLLQGVPRELFEQKYGLSRESLRIGGEALANDDSSLGETLFGAATGIHNVRAMLDDLSDEITDLLSSFGNARGNKGKIKDAAAKWGGAKKAFTDSRRAADGYQRAKKDAQQVDGQRAQAQAAVAELESQRSRLQRAQAVVAKVLKRKSLDESIIECGEVIDGWSSELEEERKDLVRDRAQKSGDLKKLKEKQAKAIREKEELEAAVSEDLLALEERISELSENNAGFVSACRDAAGLEESLRIAEDEVVRIASSISECSEVGEARDLLPSSTTLSAASKVLAAGATLDDRLKEARVNLDAIERRRQGLVDEHGEVDAAELLDTTIVEQAVKRTETVDYKTLADKEAEYETRKRELENAAAAMTRTKLGLSELLEAEVPMSETLEEFDSKITEAATEVKARRQKVESLQAQIAGFTEQMKNLQTGGNVPTRDELLELRDARAGVWARVCALIGGGSRAAKESTSPEALIDQFDQAQGAADECADTMMAAGELVGEMEGLRRQASECTEQLAKAEEELESAQASEVTINTEWQKLWTRISVDPGSPKVMRGWLADHGKLLADHASMLAVMQDVNSLRKRAERARKDLVTALTSVGKPPAGENLSVELLRGIAETLISDEAAKRDAKTNLDIQLGGIDNQINDAKGKLQRAQGERDEWITRWSVAANGIGLAADVLPEVGSATIEAFDELSGALSKYDAAFQALSRNSSIIDSYEKGLASALELLSDDIRQAHVDDDLPADQNVRKLAAAIQAIRQSQILIDNLAPTIKENAGSIDDLETAIESAETRIGQLLEIAGARDEEDLELAAARWAEREKLMLQRKDLDAEIIDEAQMNFKDVSALLEQTSPEELPRAIHSLGEQISEAVQRVDNLHEQLKELNEKCGELRVSAESEKHLADMDDAREKIERYASRYVPLKLQYDFMQQWLREHSAEHMGPVIRKASELFGELTCGAYKGITRDIDDKDQEVLRLIPSGSEPEKDKDALSSGTRDQLYLALRIASICQHLDTGAEPIPFIVDDIITTFDNERSAATIRVLHELAKRTQVLFFTHERHLVDLAERVVGDLPEDEQRLSIVWMPGEEGGVEHAGGARAGGSLVGVGKARA